MINWASANGTMEASSAANAGTTQYHLIDDMAEPNPVKRCRSRYAKTITAAMAAI